MKLQSVEKSLIKIDFERMIQRVEVRCDVTDCKHWNNGECAAETVDLEGGRCIDYDKEDNGELVYPAGIE